MCLSNTERMAGPETSTTAELPLKDPLLAPTVHVVGGGPVGALNALYLSKRGYNVDLFELRKDIRTMEVVKGRSINLALSHRGIEALKGVGLDQEVLSWVIPMKGRMIHSRTGGTMSQLYGTNGECIHSVDRRRLNEVLLTALERMTNATVHYEHRLEDINLDTGAMVFDTPLGEVKAEGADVVFGNDGAYSKVRATMQKTYRFNYEQTYIEHGYKELTMPPGPDGDFAMPPNYLHIWPCQSFMMIALPNQDKSFTVTLFMPFTKFDEIKTKEELVAFFATYFADAIPLIGKDRLVEDYFAIEPQHLMMVKCSPYHHGKAVLMGDAAHAMVPFFGQGMNAGFEDCLIFDELCDAHKDNLSKVLPAFTERRCADGHAICDLALRNYVEMRSSVTSRMYQMRRHLERTLYRLFPGSFMPLYNMVSFSRTPYAQVVAQAAKQSRLVDYSAMATALAGSVVAAAVLRRALASR